MVPAHDTDDVSLLLREANGTQFSLDFGKPLQGPPGGLMPMQLVIVIGVLDAGELFLPAVGMGACQGPENLLRLNSGYCGLACITTVRTWQADSTACCCMSVSEAWSSNPD